MSQAKVDRYKQEKANRKENVMKEKKANAIRKGVALVIAVALIGWAGYSAVNAYQTYQPNESVEIDYTAVDNLNTNLSE